METIFLHYIQASRPTAYALIFASLLLEGEFVLFVAFLLVHQGFLDIKTLVPIALFGVMLGDYFWYSLGTILANKQNRITASAKKAGKIFINSITSHPLRTLTISKFTYGLHRSTLILFGMHRISQKTFMRADGVAATLWLIAVGVFAIATSSSLSLAKYYLKYTEIFLLVAVVVWYGLMRYMTKVFKNYQGRSSASEINQANDA